MPLNDEPEVLSMDEHIARLNIRLQSAEAGESIPDGKSQTEAVADIKQQLAFVQQCLGRLVRTRSRPVQ